MSRHWYRLHVQPMKTDERNVNGVNFIFRCGRKKSGGQDSHIGDRGGQKSAVAILTIKVNGGTRMAGTIANSVTFVLR